MNYTGTYATSESILKGKCNNSIINKITSIFIPTLKPKTQHIGKDYVTIHELVENKVCVSQP